MASADDHLEARLAALADRVEALERENAQLRAAWPAPSGATDPGSSPGPAIEAAGAAGSAPFDPPTPTPSRVSRRGLLLGAGAAAAGVVGAAAMATPAAAANGDVMHVGQAHVETIETAIINQASAGSDLSNTIGLVVNSLGPMALSATAGSSGSATTSVYGAISGFSDSGPGLLAINQVSTKPAVLGRHGTGSTNFVIESGVFGESIDSAGVAGSSASNAGVVGRSTLGTGLLASAPGTSGIGVGIVSAGTAIQFSELGDRSDPNADTTHHVNGEVVYDVDGTLWYCTEAGTPGTWRKVAGDGTAGQFHVLPVPIRIYDSRAGTLPSLGLKKKFTANEVRVLDTTANSSGVPRGAVAVSVTCLLVNAANANGNFTIWANGASKPASNTLVWGGSAGRFTTPAITALDAAGRCQVAPSAPTDLVVDVVGYYR